MRSVRRRSRLRARAFFGPLRVALAGRTLVATKTSSRRPAIASATSSSAFPLAYISAVSISVRPRSIPSSTERSSSARSAGFSPIPHVPCPSAGIRSPEGRLIVRIDTALIVTRGAVLRDVVVNHAKLFGRDLDVFAIGRCPTGLRRRAGGRRGNADDVGVVALRRHRLVKLEPRFPENPLDESHDLPKRLYRIV